MPVSNKNDIVNNEGNGAVRTVTLSCNILTYIISPEIGSGDYT